MKTKVLSTGAHIAQEEIVESEDVFEGENDVNSEKADDGEEDEDDFDENDEERNREKATVVEAYSHEVSRNSALRLQVNNLTKASTIFKNIVYKLGR